MKPNSDHALQIALKELEEEELQGFLHAPEAKWEESKHFQARMRAILWQPSGRSRHSRLAWKKTFFIAAVIAALLATTVCVEAIRTPVMHFFLQFTESGTDFVPIEDSCSEFPNEIERVFLPQALPVEFIRTASSVLPRQASATWQASDGWKIQLTQKLVLSGEKLDTTSASFSRVPELGGDGYLVEKNGYFSVVWVEEGYCFRLTYPAKLGKDACLECAQSLQEQKSNP